MRHSSIIIAAFLMLPAFLPAQAAKITVTESQCAGVTAHTPDASVAYTPGVTATGAPVAPANLPGSSFTVTPPKKITIDIDIELQERFGLPANAGQYVADAKIGKVTVEDGKAYFNGQPLATGNQNAIAEACKALKKQR